jgi:SAM-dependent methyltransferase
LSEYDRWETRYRVPDYIFGQEPNYFLASCKNLLPKSGRALAVADGEARNGVWLAEQGLDILSLDFSPSAQAKAAALARERGVKIAIERADVHSWAYPEAAFDVVCEIFTQFSSPTERARKWAGMKRSLKRGGLLILLGYTPKQLEYGTGGPKEIENLYTRAMLEEAFGEFHDARIVEEELEMHEGAAHAGLSAVIGMTARK